MLPQYMAIGMSPEEFWHGEPRLCGAYRKAWAIRQENAYLAEWRAGVYAERAHAYVLDHALSKHPKAEFPEEPLWCTPEMKRQREAIKEREQTLRARDAFKARVAAFNAAFRARQAEKQAGGAQDKE